MRWPTKSLRPEQVADRGEVPQAVDTEEMATATA